MRGSKISFASSRRLSTIFLLRDYNEVDKQLFVETFWPANSVRGPFAFGSGKQVGEFIQQLGRVCPVNSATVAHYEECSRLPNHSVKHMLFVLNDL